MTTNEEAQDIRSYLDWADKGKATFWRYLGAILLVVVAWQLPASFIKVFFTEQHPTSYPLTKLMVLVVPVVIGLACLPLTVRKVLKRPGYSVTLPHPPPRWSDLGLGVGVGLAVMAVVTIVMLPFSGARYEGFDQILDLKLFVPLLLVAVVGLLAQTALEEHLFRGFLCRPPIGGPHSGWIVIGVQAFVFALTMGWVAWRTGSLVISIGLHFANNFFLALFVVTRGDVISSVAPFSTRTPSVASGAAFAVLQSALTIAAVGFLTRNRLPVTAHRAESVG